MHIGRYRFEELVAQALDGLPKWVHRHLENVDVLIEEHPPRDDPQLLGLYEGVPLTARDAAYSGMVMPDRITIFRRTICAVASSEDEVVDQVRTTVVHEVAHHFGIDDDRLRELGWG
jgi:predicted Zn-dependent protease with MMP-like domain